MEQEAVGQPGTRSLNLILKSSIKEDDPFKESKTKQITRWIYRNYDISDHFENAVSTAISEDDCWINDNIYGKRLDTKVFVQKLIENSSKNNYETLSAYYCYSLACLNCLDEKLICNLFELNKEIGKRVHNSSEDDVLGESYRILERFWGHYITNKLERIQKEDLECKYYDRNPNIYGFKSAYYDHEREAVAFFYKRLLEDQSISEESRLNLLVEAALYSASGTAGNSGVDTVIFCLQEVMDNKQQLEFFLMKFSNPRGPSILYRLIAEGYFDTVYKLFPIQAQFFDIEEYSSLLSVISRIGHIGFREKLLDGIIELGRNKFWQELPEFDSNEFYFLLRKFAEHGCKKAFQELWKAYSDDQRQYVFFDDGSDNIGRSICNILYKNGDKESLKEFLFCYAKNNKAVLEDIDQFINNIDILVNNYYPIGDVDIQQDKNNKFIIINDKIKKTLPQLMEVFNEKRIIHDTNTSPIPSNDGNDTIGDAIECLGRLDVVE